MFRPFILGPFLPAEKFTLIVARRPPKQGVTATVQLNRPPFTLEKALLTEVNISGCISIPRRLNERVLENKYFIASTVLIGLAVAFWAGVQTGKPDSVGAGVADEQPGETSFRSRSAPSRQTVRPNARRSLGSNIERSNVFTSDAEAKIRGANLATRIGDILNDLDRVDRDQKFIGFLSELQTADLAALAESIRAEGEDGALGGDKYAWHRSFLLDAWMKGDPDAAVAWAKGGERNRLLVDWGERKPSQALAWLKTTTGGGQDSRAKGDTLEVVRGLLRVDLEQAMGMVETMNDSWARNTSLRNVLEKMYENDPEQAKFRVGSIRDPKLRAEAAGFVASQLVETDVEQAKQWVADLGGEERSNAAVQLARTLSYKDSEGARSWVSELEEGEARANAVIAVVEGSAKQDPSGIAIWLNQFPPAGGYDEARRKFALSITEIDPGAARDWASSIVDVKSREYWQGVVAEKLEKAQ